MSPDEDRCRPPITLRKLTRNLPLLAIIALIAAIAGSASATGTARAEGPNAVVNLVGCTAHSIPANDDDSSPSVALPFTLNFFGKNYSALYVNNNGNVTFDGPLGEYTPFGLNGTQSVIVAPFFADVDTRGAGSGLVTYGPVTYAGRSAFCANWVNVGYYSENTDKLNSFQLLLVDRSDTGTGNFDILFNYDKVLFETGDLSGGTNGLGGSSAHVGYSNGTSTSFELPGSGVPGSFLNSNTSTGLIYNSRDSLQVGRFLFPVRNGVAPTGGSISGTVYANSAAPANVLQGAFVAVCSGGACHTTPTNASGQYSVTGLANGSYTVDAYPPGSSSALPGTIGPLVISGGAALTGKDIVLVGPTPFPAGTTITPSDTGGGLPVVLWTDPLVLTTHGCTGGTASYQVTQNGTLVRSGAMTESPAGTYKANVPAFSPAHGDMHVKITLQCTGGTTLTEGDIYVDPSGVVKTTDGTPIQGATVTLLRSDSAAGPFIQVPNGSGIMSPANRTNPDLTDSAGHFGWDVIAGYYIVRAVKSGCTSALSNGQVYAETSVMQIPPPVTDLQLILHCGGAWKLNLPMLRR